MIVKRAESQKESGFQVYKEMVKTGRFYEYMEEMMERELKISHIDRKAVKAAVFQVLFTDNRFIGQSEAKDKRMFKSLFPEVYHLLSLIK